MVFFFFTWLHCLFRSLLGWINSCWHFFFYSSYCGSVVFCWIFLWNFFGYLVFCTIFNIKLDLVVVYGVNRNCNLIFVNFFKKSKNLCTNQTPKNVFLGIFRNMTKHLKTNFFLVEKYFMLEINHLFQRKRRRNKKKWGNSTLPSFF